MIKYSGHVFKHVTKIEDVTLFIHSSECQCGRKDLDSYAIEPDGDHPFYEIWRPLIAIEDLYHDSQGYCDLSIEEFAVKMGIGELIEDDT